MTVTELIAALGGANPEDNVTINVGGTQVEDFDVDVVADAVVLRGREETTSG